MHYYVWFNIAILFKEFLLRTFQVRKFISMDFVTNDTKTDKPRQLYNFIQNKSVLQTFAFKEMFL